MSASRYFSRAIEAIEQVAEDQADTIREAAALMTSAIQNDCGLFAFGASHSFMMAEEMVYRTGGLMLINPIYPHGMNLGVRPLTMTSKIERLTGLGVELLEGAGAVEDDVLLLFSTSGRNAVAIDMAIHAGEKGLKTVGVTSLAYTGAVSSRHPSGKKLADICDVVIDNGAPYGDAAVAIDGFDGKVGPLSSVTGCAIVNAIVSETVKMLVDNGVVPPVFVSANVDGGDEHNEQLLENNAHRIRYL